MSYWTQEWKKIKQNKKNKQTKKQERKIYLETEKQRNKQTKKTKKQLNRGMTWENKHYLVGGNKHLCIIREEMIEIYGTKRDLTYSKCFLLKERDN